MKMNVKNTLIVAILTTFFVSHGHAFDLDETVDDEIRKNYNPSKLVHDVGGKRSALEKKMESAPKSATVSHVDENLPALPNISKQVSSSSSKQVKPVQTETTKASGSITVPKNNRIHNPKRIKISDGTSFDVVSSTAISDWQAKGAIVKFVTKTPIVKRKYTIPASTVFIGEVIESHRPQITCNGGLVVIRINAMVYNGQRIPVNAYVTKANGKKIFLNNIKGDRTFWKTLWAKGSWGRKTFSKMLTVSGDLGSDGATLILAPFPVAYGTVCLGLNAAVSPLCTFFSKGGRVSIPAGSNFRIKLMDDLIL